MVKFNDASSDIENPDRREAMSAIMKYSAVVGGATATVLTASEAIAKSAASGAGHANASPEYWEQGRRESKYWGDTQWEKWREWERWRETKIKGWEK